MASYLAQARSVLTQAAVLVEKKAVPMLRNAFDATVKDGQQYIVKDPEAAAKLPKQLFYTSLDSLPRRYAEAKKEWSMVKSMNWGEMNVASASLYGAFAVEVLGWFSLGEIVGRGGSVGGYKGQ